MKEYKVIDISKYQGAVNFKKIKNDGVDGVIIRCGYTGYGKAKNKNIDSRWESNCKAAKEAGIPFGAYYYSCAVTPEEAKSEAEFVLKLIEGKKLSYPLFFDTEDNHDIKLYSPESQLSIGKKRLTAVAKNFLETLEKSGVYCGIYASKSWLENQLDMSALSAYDVWVAQYASKLTYKGAHSMWQYSNTGRVNGIDGNVDLNRCYVDYPSLIAEKENSTVQSNLGSGMLIFKLLLAVARELGIISCAVDNTAAFDEKTRAATAQLQAATGFAQSGIPDEKLALAAKELSVKKAAAMNAKISAALEALK